MVAFHAFRAVRPVKELASKVAAVPYDVVDTVEGRKLAEGNPYSLLHVSRPDIDLPDGTDMYSDIVYERAHDAFEKLKKDGVMVQDPKPHFYLYAQTMEGRRQIGLVGLASAKDYWENRIKKHELTRIAKENDRLRHIETVHAHLGPVFLTYRPNAEIDARVAQIVSGAPEVDFVAVDGIRHQVWVISDDADLKMIEQTFAGIDAFYIADGHHRAAAASRLGKGLPDDDPKAHFLAVAFPSDQLKILPYNRVIVDLNGLTPDELIAKMGGQFEIKASDGKDPTECHHFSMYLNGQWYAMALRSDVKLDLSDPVSCLDVSLLQKYVLAPLLGIDDPRTSSRIDFVGGIRGSADLKRRVDEGEAKVAFAMYPTSLDELMSIADAGQVMPPKSTWFEPKLRSGLIISVF